MTASGDVLFCHATPRNDTEIFTRLTPDEPLLPIFGGLGVPVAVCGHTHMQFDRTIGTVRVVNAGSVGMPFGEPGAYWLLLGPDVAAPPHVLRSGRGRPSASARRQYPKAEEFAARNVLQPPSEQDILDAFSQRRIEVRVAFVASRPLPSCSALVALIATARHPRRCAGSCAPSGRIRDSHERPAARLQASP